MKLSILKVKTNFIEKKGFKYRPVLQLNNPGDEYSNFQVAYITSVRPGIILQTDLIIDETKKYFSKTGLLTNSYIRFTKIYTINSSEVECIIEDFSVKENDEVNKILKSLFNII